MLSLTHLRQNSRLGSANLESTLEGTNTYQGWGSPPLNTIASPQIRGSPTPETTRPRTIHTIPKCSKCNAHGHVSSDCFLDNPGRLEGYLQQHPNSEKYWRRKVERYNASKPKSKQVANKRAPPRPTSFPRFNTYWVNERIVAMNTEQNKARGFGNRVLFYSEGLGLTWDEQSERDVVKHRSVIKWANAVDTNTDLELDVERESDNKAAVQATDKRDDLTDVSAVP